MISASCIRLLRWFLLVLSGCLAGYAQATLHLEIVRTNETDAVITWTAKSVVPAPGFKIVPDFRAEISSDLENWFDYGTILLHGQSLPQGKVGMTLNNFHECPVSFLRIISSIDLSGADLIGQTLDGGDLTGAFMPGAEMFTASL